MMSGNFSQFLNWPSVFITVGGTLGAIIVSFPPSRLKNLGPVMKKAFTQGKTNLQEDLETIVALSEITRREGLLALEDSIDNYNIDDDFMKRGIMLIIDGADEEQLRNSLEAETYFMQQRHQRGYGMVDMIATVAPALSLMGTYIGLIPMLTSLEDPRRLGPLMAVELVTSFYGAFLAYVIFSPIAKRLKTMNADEVARREFLLEGLVAIQKGQNPKIIREELSSYLRSKQDADAMGRQQQSEMNPKKVA